MFWVCCQADRDVGLDQGVEGDHWRQTLEPYGLMGVGGLPIGTSIKGILSPFLFPTATFPIAEIPG